MSVAVADITVTGTGQVIKPSMNGNNSDALSWVEFTNASAFAMQAQFGSLVFQIPAWYDYPVRLRDASGNILPGLTVPPSLTVGAQTIPGNAGVATLHTTLFLKGETPQNTIPGPLGGSPINLSTATNLTNTNSAPATPIVFAEPVGDTSANGAVNLNNQGQLTLGDATYNGSLALLGVAGPQISMFVSNLNAVLRLIDTNGNVDVDLESGSTTLIGGTSGSAAAYVPFRGLWKVAIIQLANFKTAGANQQLALPTNFGFRALVLATDAEGFQLLSGGVGQSVRQWTAFAAAGSGGATQATTTMQGFNLFWLATAFDTIQFNAGWGSARNGVILIIGQ